MFKKILIYSTMLLEGDNMFAALNIKTGNYLLSSMIKIPQLIKVAKENGIKALTITDNNMYGVIDFYKECVKNGIKPIVGLEVCFDYKFVLYCQNYDGYLNLIKIATLMSENKLDINSLANLTDNLLVIVPYESRSLYKDLNKIFKYVFIGYKNDIEKSKIRSNNTVYMNEVWCLYKEDEKYLRYLWAIRDGVKVTEVDFPLENVSLIPFVNNDEENNKKICELCNLELKFNQNLMPKLEGDSYDKLKKDCVSSLKSIFGQEAPRVYIDRLKMELEVIKKMGFCDYFLIVADYIKYSKENNILVGPGRGSAAGSLVAFLIGITTIDPVRYNLLFERFLNPERVTMPDIDVDFEDVKRDLVSNYCISKYGIKKVAPIITFGTLGPRQVIRDVGRASSVDIKKVDILSKMIDPKISLRDNYKKDNVRNFLEINSEFNDIYKIALKFEGLKRHTSVHAAGIVMSNKDLDTVIPLDKSHGDFYTTGYDMTYLEEIGLLKMDFLGLKNLTLISNILTDIGKFSFDDIPLNDKKALRVFESVNTVGIFQFESEGMMNFLRKFKPNTFEDIVASLALFRPGPMRNIDTYIRRRRGVEKVQYIHKDLEKILKSTYGIIVYQEQIMQIANVMAGYSMAQADNLRRAMSKKKEDVLLKEKDRFISQSVSRGYEQKVAREVYDLILRFASYGFNRSHSVAYAMTSYKMAYLKAHYPAIFMKNLLSSAINSDVKTREYIYESKKNGLDVLLPDINVSCDNYVILKDKIVFPLTNIKGVGPLAAKHIIEEREKGLFKDIFDFIKRCYGKAVNLKVLENLILAGVFDRLGYNRRTLMENMEIIVNYSELGDLLEDTLKPELNIVSEYSKKELMSYELLVFGFYLSNNPITEERTKHSGTIEMKDLRYYFNKNVTVIVSVDKIKTIKTKKNETMMFITGSDEISKGSIVVFPKVYQTYFGNVGDIIKVTGKVERRFDQMQIIAMSIVKLN